MTQLHVHPDVDDVVVRIEPSLGGFEHVDGEWRNANCFAEAFRPLAGEFLGRVPYLLNDSVILDDDDVGEGVAGRRGAGGAASLHRHQEAEACHIAVGCHVPDAEEEGVWLGSFGLVHLVFIIYGFLCGIYQAIEIYASGGL